jgi:hypothetical protein
VDCAIHTTAAEQRSVGGVNNCINLLLGDVTSQYGNAIFHKMQTTLALSIIARIRFGVSWPLSVWPEKFQCQNAGSGKTAPF